MTYGDIKNKDYEERKQINEKRNSELLKELNDGLQESEYEFSNVSVDFEKYEEAGEVRYDFRLSDGYSQTDSAYWRWDESVSDIIQYIKRHVEYIEKLRQDYPEYASHNDHIQKYRKFERTCKLTNNGFTREANVSALLCGYLKLPNTTECGVGGGDYELRRTPQRVEDFNNNIDTLCLFLADCIGDLRGMKVNQLIFCKKVTEWNL